jgi:hypothetical protein
VESSSPPSTAATPPWAHRVADWDSSALVSTPTRSPPASIPNEAPVGRHRCGQPDGGRQSGHPAPEDQDVEIARPTAPGSAHAGVTRPEERHGRGSWGVGDGAEIRGIEVVDQAHRAHGGGDEEAQRSGRSSYGPARGRRRARRPHSRAPPRLVGHQPLHLRLDDRRIVPPRPAAPTHRPGAPGTGPAPPVAARPRAGRSGWTGPGRRGRAPSRNRPPRPAATGRGPPGHHGQLLEVLLPEVGPAPAGRRQQLDHHGGHAVEVPRAGRTLPPALRAGTDTVVVVGPATSGYISATEGAKTRCPPAAGHHLEVGPEVRG